MQAWIVRGRGLRRSYRRDKDYRQAIDTAAVRHAPFIGQIRLTFRRDDSFCEAVCSRPVPPFRIDCQRHILTQMGN